MHTALLGNVFSILSLLKGIVFLFYSRLDTSVAPLIFADQFIQISTKLPSKYIYGFGEHEHPTYLHDTNWKSYGMFTRDQYPKVCTFNLYNEIYI